MLKVMSINVRYINNFDEFQWKDRKNILFGIIDQYKPDIIGFQEVMEESLEDLINYLEEYSYYGVYRSLISEREMNPIFYRNDMFTNIESNTLWLSESPIVRYSLSWDSSLPRVVSYAVLESKSNNDNLIVINTHFDHIGEEARVNSTEIILNLAEELKSKYNYSVLISGDFNTTPEEGFIDRLINSELYDNSYNHFEDKSNTLTIHNFTGEVVGSPIDYIFVDKDLKIKESIIIRDSIDGIYPSDHYQLYMEIK